MKGQKTLVIYFTEDKKSYQVIKPSEHFAGDWKGLADTIAGAGGYFNYVVV